MMRVLRMAGIGMVAASMILLLLVLQMFIPLLVCKLPTDLGYGYIYKYGDHETHISKGDDIVVDMNILRFSVIDFYVVGLRRVEPEPLNPTLLEPHYFLFNMATGELKDGLSRSGLESVLREHKVNPGPFFSEQMPLSRFIPGAWKSCFPFKSIQAVG